VNLYIIRHAKTEKIATSGNDFDRQLSEKGRLQSQKLNEILATFDLKNVEIWCSDAARTKETLSYIDKHFPSTNIEFKNELYLASAKTILDLIWNSDSNRDLLIIGHNEGISELAAYFISDVEFMHVRTATFLQISIKADCRQEWSADLGKLEKVIRPSL